MPLIKVTTSVPCDQSQKEKIAKEMSKITAEGIGKPEQYVAAVVEDGAAITFNGSSEKAAFVEVKSIGGLNSSVNNTLCASICQCLEESLQIKSNHVYINLVDVPASNWGVNGSTFG